ncbi:DNA cytosine methyltransferase [Aurantiacibacter sediminis]|uniref:Cytosine-specific methyltransferase n=1 Tax=Aurantiacibacter sediminis TaxID=2793064 RepID=A0ABS0N2S0_9SPHN|nr:DNA cytosine methyltransferase [Aurantiacibacter sediminis]MBH5321595.1 DNA cytosine methyltransferase [Aurantiacibacter sediminis]
MKIVDLFCGCGGLSLGLERAGFEILWACDNWDKAVNVYADNFSHRVEEMDVSNVFKTANKIRPLGVDGIVGGPPCQDFSTAGKRSEGDRANLTRSFADVIAAIRPTFFIMENVARAKSSRAYAEASDFLRSQDYGLTEVTLNASLCGVPQRRKRFFCIGIRDLPDQFLEDVIQRNLAAKEMTVRDYMSDEIDFEFYYRHPRNYNRRAVYTIDEPAATVRGVNRPVPSGYPGHRADAAPIDQSIRALSTSERSRLQTFPRGFTWDAAKTHLELMIGNAVPVELGHYVGRCLMEGLGCAASHDGKIASFG